MTLSQAQVPHLYNGENINTHLLHQLRQLQRCAWNRWMVVAVVLTRHSPPFLKSGAGVGAGEVVRLDCGVLRFPPRPAG